MACTVGPHSMVVHSVDTDNVDVHGMHKLDFNSAVKKNVVNLFFLPIQFPAIINLVPKHIFKSNLP
jgi:hypothetical protein